MRHLIAIAILSGGAASAVAVEGEEPFPGRSVSPPPLTSVHAETGIAVPAGFTVSLVAQLDKNARHIAVRENGDLFVSIRRRSDEHLAALRDADGDGRFERIEYAAGAPGTGLAIHGDHLYFAGITEVYRVALDDGLMPAGEPEVLVGGLPAQRSHDARPITFDEAGHLYVNLGSPSNASQKERRTPGSPGVRPSPDLEWQGSIWRFDADRPGQTLRGDGVRHSTGHRQVVALEWNDHVDALFLVMHGRDQLNYLFPDKFSATDNARLPAEEFHRVPEGANLGWPYTYWNPFRSERMVAPEFGGDRDTVSEEEYREPLIGFPAHWAPNDLIFYGHDAFPERYRKGAFIAWHGSWNRAPFEQRGYNVTFVPFADGADEPTGAWEVFADGFTGSASIQSPGEADHRPCGLAVGNDGELFVVDSVKGRIFRIAYVGG